MAARNRTWTPEVVRQRIRTSMLTKRLTDHVLGKVEMSPSQVTAGLGLLKKTLPDLSAVAHSGSVELTKPDELSDAELAHIATGGRPGIVGPTPSPPEPDEVH
jgi:hypothetical protein